LRGPTAMKVKASQRIGTKRVRELPCRLQLEHEPGRFLLFEVRGASERVKRESVSGAAESRS
jgi:hypothetical protein